MGTHVSTHTLNMLTQVGADMIDSTFQKARYVAYTDANFTTRMPIPDVWTHLQLLGPVIRGVVGDNITVIFRNNASIPLSIHAHGLVRVDDQGFVGVDSLDDGVRPGETFQYEWRVPVSAGPGPGDGSSVLWSYHSYVTREADMMSGLVGPIIVTSADYISDAEDAESGVPNDVDREFVLMVGAIDETVSHYFQYSADLGGGMNESLWLEECRMTHVMPSING